MFPHSQTLKLVVGIIGNVTGFAVNLAPMKMFYHIYKRKDSQKFSSMPYVFSLASAMIWVLYGLPSITQNALLIITINVISSLIQSFYIIIYLSFAEKELKRHLMRVMGTCFLFVALLAELTLKVVPRNTRSLTVGSVCVVIGIVTYASPLTVAKAVIRTRSVRFLPILLCIALLMNSTIWTCYGIITTDIFVLIPNGVGVVFGVAQITLYAKYCNATPLDGFPEKSKKGDAHSMNGDDKSFHKPDKKSVSGDDTSFQEADEISVSGDDKLPPSAFSSPESPSVADSV